MHLDKEIIPANLYFQMPYSPNIRHRKIQTPLQTMHILRLKTNNVIRTWNYRYFHIVICLFSTSRNSRTKCIPESIRNVFDNMKQEFQAQQSN